MLLNIKFIKLQKKLEEDYKNSIKEGYYCTACDKQFSSLDAQIIMTNYIFKCDDCNGELVENGTINNLENLLNAKFMNSIQDIIILLKELDQFEIPSMDFFQLNEFKKEMLHKVEENEQPLEEITEEQFIINNDMHNEDIIIKQSSDEDIIKDTRNEMVTVKGISKMYSEITEEDKEQMDEDEYEKYFEVYSKYNS